MDLGGVACGGERNITLKHHGVILISIFYFATGIACIAQSGQTDYVPKSGQPGKDVVWVGNPSVMVQKMLDMAEVTASDYVVDLGSGDGRNVIAAAKRGAHAHGIEYDKELVDFSKRLAAKEGVSDKATFERGDVFLTDFSKASVVVLFLTPEMNIRLRPKLLSLKPGTRVVANTFAIGDWNPDRILTDVGGCERFCTARLWIVPAKVDGTWSMPQGEFTLKQTYQSFSGKLKNGASTLPVSGRLHGDEINFYSGKTQYTARVEGDVMEGFARTAGVDSKFRAKRID
ncbi:MAG TPA: class I SAM-dependent methyltransferase [Acidobacteriota bacterium]|nr:class I SAM-dependent methyltransferase [Acidobacteriota bacterium]